jgi:hypothetical protein
MSRRIGLIEQRLEALSHQMGQEYRETYGGGYGGPTIVSRGTQYWKAGTTPQTSGSNIIFTQCDGTTVTLSPLYGGTLSATGSIQTYGYC